MKEIRVVNVRSHASLLLSDAIIISIQLLRSYLTHIPIPYSCSCIYNTCDALLRIDWLCIEMAILSSLALLPISLSFHSKPLLHNPPTPNRIRAQLHNGGCLSPGEDLPSDYETWMPTRDAKSRRRAGILLHPTSFPGPFGIGDLGPQAFHFLDWLHHAGCSVWQVQRLHSSFLFYHRLCYH